MAAVTSRENRQLDHFDLIVNDKVISFFKLRQFRRTSKAHAYHMSEEEKKKRKKTVKKVKT